MRLSEILGKAVEKVLVEKIAAAIFLGVGGVVALLSQFSETWGLSVMYGLGAGAFASMIYYFAVRQPMLLVAPPSPVANGQAQEGVTPDNIRTVVRDWLDSYGVNVRMVKPEEAPQARFAMLVTPKSNVKVTVLQTKKDERYLQLQASITVGEEHRDTLAKLTEEQRVDIYEEVSLELARARLGFKMPYPLEET